VGFLSVDPFMCQYERALSLCAVGLVPTFLLSEAQKCCCTLKFSAIQDLPLQTIQSRVC